MSRSSTGRIFLVHQIHAVGSIRISNGSGTGDGLAPIRGLSMRRWLSTTAGNDEESPGEIMANVVQGPSLLLTGRDRPSPSLMMLPGLRSLPFWTSFDGQTNRVAYQDPVVSQAVGHLEEHYDVIREEVVEKTQKVFSDYDVAGRGGEHANDSLHTGTWDWHSYMLKGKVQGSFVQHFAETSSVLRELQKEQLLFDGNPFGFAFVSKLSERSTIQPHTSPVNFRLRIHLPLVVPFEEAGTAAEEQPSCGIRVGPTTKRWTEGKALVLDDSYDHEVWNNTSTERVLLLVDIWHPDVSNTEKERIRAMFVHAHQQGWLTNT